MSTCTIRVSGFTQAEAERGFPDLRDELLARRWLRADELCWDSARQQVVVVASFRGPDSDGCVVDAILDDVRDAVFATMPNNESDWRFDVEEPDPDEQALSNLLAAGADLTKRAHVRFYIYAATEQGANRIATIVADSQLTVAVRRAALGEAWLCLVESQLIPALDTFKRYRTQFEALAVAEDGEYDGWEAAVVE